ncbi:MULTISPECIES: hypothetical protein [Rhizobium]|uniref:Uncharacterized protein n=1 Tax=Rhizobium rhododendri TaxID=2506430 RepID=A0ABY8IN03_9HYPH|nr:MULTISPECIES: hypothetical protein [Rhizobium]MBZ5758372.1 hypothetical protein [Rhizobium sp. VS19-DR96]MBZ5764798.1 hypothetical protein [Rhizobium sp. VS19-DR129.2]MBZ5772341.1 hypothetical protein [Rhizobium sp. VS19-DRK62.2]MBZ5782972.1 hypothetical protein [Rhizobium sp. VS19-DR121]MBZ5800420.1 hypothetical protein [Rhizobium sp. VS19-DR181]
MTNDKAAANNNNDVDAKKLDPTSDAARSDPKQADAHREELKKTAEKGFDRALDKSPEDKR